MGASNGIQFLFLFAWWVLATFAGSSSAGERSTYIVHMDRSFMPKAFVSHSNWYSSMIDSVKSSDSLGSNRLVYTYDNAFHGFSALLSEHELDSLKQNPGFLSAFVDREVIVDTTHTFKFLSLNPNTGLWPASNYGKDVIIGVIDSGVWPESKSFADHGMTAPVPSKWKGKCQIGQEFNSSLCNLKLIGAQYFNKGVIAANPGITISMNSARDTDGHGTHTASTAAGNYVDDVSFFEYGPGTARGIAPRSRLAVYKVLWDEGRYASDVLAAIDQAVADGVDIISISMGFGRIPLYEDPIAIASFGAMEKGILVSLSAGNRGPGRQTLHNGIPWALTVAAGSTDRLFAATLTLGNGLEFTGWTVFPARAAIITQSIIYNTTIFPCNSTTLFDEFFSGIVICDAREEGVSAESTPMLEVSTSRASAAVFISDNPTTFHRSTFPFPGIVISTKDGKKVINYAKTHENPSARMKFQQTFDGRKPAPAVAEYSSRGPTLRYPGILKPDVLAPGSVIIAAWNPNIWSAARIGGLVLATDYNAISGTSMACPHAAGVAALLKGAHPNWSPAAIRSAIMTTANPLDNTQKPIRDDGLLFLDAAEPIGIGSGHIDPNRALDPGLIYDASPQEYANNLCSMNYTKKQFQTVTRSKSFSCSKSSSDLNYPSFIALYNPSAPPKNAIQKFQRTVTNVGNGKASYKVKVTAPAGSVVKVSPETLEFGKTNDKQSYSLTIRYSGDKDQTLTFGSITWVEVNGKHSVRSPIVVSAFVDSDD